MNTITVRPFGDPTGACLQSEVIVSYAMLCKMLGKPKKIIDGYKVDAEWVLGTPFGTGTIYNYKDGRNYLGKEGLAMKDITEWHIGGLNKETGIIIQTAS